MGAACDTENSFLAKPFAVFGFNRAALWARHVTYAREDMEKMLVIGFNRAALWARHVTEKAGYITVTRTVLVSFNRAALWARHVTRGKR